MTSYQILALLVLSLLIYLIYFAFSRKCSNCKKYGSLRIKNKELIESQNTTVKETVKTRNKKGEVIRSREVFVPAVKKTYRVYLECNKCKNIETKLETITSKK